LIPKENGNAITLQSGKELENQMSIQTETKEEEEIEIELA
jgi:hypothetical protein